MKLQNVGIQSHPGLIKAPEHLKLYLRYQRKTSSGDLPKQTPNSILNASYAHVYVTYTVCIGRHTVRILLSAPALHPY